MVAYHDIRIDCSDCGGTAGQKLCRWCIRAIALIYLAREP